MNNRWRQVRRVRRQEAARQRRKAMAQFEALNYAIRHTSDAIDAVCGAACRAAEVIGTLFEEMLSLLHREEDVHEKHQHPDL